MSLRLLLLAALFAVPASAMAQGPSALLLRVPSSPSEVGGTTGRTQPGVTTSTPIGFGPSFRDVFVGVGYQASTRYGGKHDGAVSAGFGLGNSDRLVGLEVVLTSLSTFRGGFGERMVAGFKVHRNLPMSTAIGIGMEGIKVAGDAFEISESIYVVGSKVASLSAGPYFRSSIFTVGAGNGRFQNEEDAIAGADNFNVFGAFGLRVTDWFSAIGEWTGQDMNVGASFAVAPGNSLHVVITPAIVDLLEQAGDGPRFTLGAGLSWRF